MSARHRRVAECLARRIRKGEAVRAVLAHVSHSDLPEVCGLLRSEYGIDADCSGHVAECGLLEEVEVSDTSSPFRVEEVDGRPRLVRDTVTQVAPIYSRTGIERRIAGEEEFSAEIHDRIEVTVTGGDCAAVDTTLEAPASCDDDACLQAVTAEAVAAVDDEGLLSVAPFDMPVACIE